MNPAVTLYMIGMIACLLIAVAVTIAVTVIMPCLPGKIVGDSKQHDDGQEAGSTGDRKRRKRRLRRKVAA